MVLAARWNGRFGNGIRRQEAMGSVSLAYCNGVLVDYICASDKNIRVYSWLFAIHAGLYKKHNQMEE